MWVPGIYFIQHTNLISKTYYIDDQVHWRDLLLYQHKIFDVLDTNIIIYFLLHISKI